VELPAETPIPQNATTRLLFGLLCVAVPVALWFAPLGIEPRIQGALAITSFMILAWMTNLMEYAVVGLIGCLLYWALGVAPPATAFGGFSSSTTWFILAALLLGVISTKSGLPQRIGNFIVTHVGFSYSRILLGLILTDFLLTFIVPTGTGRVVIMATIAIGLIKLFGVSSGSNVARGIFLIVTYTATIFDKMIIAGAAAITARGIIIEVGGVEVTWTIWFIAFLPASIATIAFAWWYTMWMFPPEIQSLENKREQIHAHFRNESQWTPDAKKAAVLLLAGVAVWMTDFIHHLDPALVALAVVLIALLPFVGVLTPDELKRTNMLPVIFVGTALSMSAVLAASGALTLLTNTVFSGLQPLLSSDVTAVPMLYWGAFFYHFFLASEISMLATSMPILMNIANEQGLNPLWIGMLWTFAAGGKLFVYQSSVLVVGYSYGFFRHSDMIKIGIALTLVEFVLVVLTVALWWPIVGIASR
jgi:anion transporter